MRLFDNFVYENGQIVNNGWVKWIHWGVPDEETEERKKFREKLAGMGHCSSCTALSGCYFLKSKIPKNQGGGGLLHPNCDCQLKQIAKLINEVKAYCAIKKFRDYIFSDKYAYNGKQELFRTLGYTINDSEWLKAEYERQAKQNYLKGDYIVRGLGEYGQDINIVIDLISPTGRSVQFISGWKVHPLGYLTCNTPLADD